MERLSNHIEEYFTKIEGSKDLITSREIFKAEKENVDVKTDIDIKEIILINKILYNNNLLKSKNLKPVWENFIGQYMRLKISLDRKSRGEYVDINRASDTGKLVQDLSNLKNISDAKK